MTIHVGDTDVAVQFTIKDDLTGTVVDLSAAASLQIFVVTATGRATRHTATAVGGGTTGKMQAILATVDNEPGIWKAQARVVKGGGEVRHSSKITFVVEGNLA